MSANQELIDTESYMAVKELLGDNLSDFLQSYFSSMESYLKEGNKALTSGNMHDLVHNVHPMKSTSAMIGAINFSELAYEIELMGRKQLEENSCNIKEIIEKFDILRSHYDQLKQVLENDL